MDYDSKPFAEWWVNLRRIADRIYERITDGYRSSRAFDVFADDLEAPTARELCKFKSRIEWLLKVNEMAGLDFDVTEADALIALRDQLDEWSRNWDWPLILSGLDGLAEIENRLCQHRLDYEIPMLQAMLDYWRHPIRDQKDDRCRHYVNRAGRLKLTPNPNLEVSAEDAKNLAWEKHGRWRTASAVGLSECPLKQSEIDHLLQVICWLPRAVHLPTEALDRDRELDRLIRDFESRPQTLGAEFRLACSELDRIGVELFDLKVLIRAETICPTLEEMVSEHETDLKERLNRLVALVNSDDQFTSLREWAKRNQDEWHKISLPRLLKKAEDSQSQLRLELTDEANQANQEDADNVIDGPEFCEAQRWLDYHKARFDEIAQTLSKQGSEKSAKLLRFLASRPRTTLDEIAVHVYENPDTNPRTIKDLVHNLKPRFAGLLPIPSISMPNNGDVYWSFSE